MFTSNPFYHKVFKRAIIAFGSMFSNIHIERRNSDGSAVQKLKVPIAQAPKEKWIVRVDSDPNLENHTYTVLPRIAFEITGVNYDPSRKLNKIGKVVCASGGTTMTFAYAPVPYNVDITLYVLTKTQEDAFQIVEQILPYFTPEFTLGVKSLDQLNVVTDIPIVLTSVSQQDDYDGDFQTRRFVTWTLNFTMKLNMFGPVSQQGIITKALIDIGNTPNSNIDPDQLELYTATNIGNTIDERITNRFAGDYRPPVGQPDVAAIDSTEVTDLLQIAKNGTVILEQTRE
jgi:hypothetical protein